MIVERYEQDDISIDVSFNSEVFINTTEPAKAFGKKTNDWLKTQSTKDYIEAFAASKNIDPADLVTVRVGGDNKNDQGTWIHPKLAVAFGRWLSPQFAVWCDDKIDSLLNAGYVGVNEAIQESLEDIAPQVKAIKKYVRKTGGGIRMNKLLEVFSAMESASHTLNDYRTTLSGITSAASTDEREKVYNKLIKGTYRAYEEEKISRRTQEDVLQILNANLIKLLRRRQTDLINKLSVKGKIDVKQYLSEIEDLKTKLEELEGQLDDPRPIKFNLGTTDILKNAIEALKTLHDDPTYKVLFNSVMHEDDNKPSQKYPDWKGDGVGNLNGLGSGIWTNDGYYFASVGTNRKPYQTFCKLELYQSPGDEDVFVGTDTQKRHFGTFNHVTGHFIVYRKK